MSVTVKLLLRESKKRSDGKAPVYLRITANRKSRFKSTGIYLRPRHWNGERQEVRKSHELASALNDRLRSLRLDAERAALEVDSARAVKVQLDGRTGSLTSFFEAFIEGLRRGNCFWRRKKYRTTLNKLQAALGRERIDWGDLNRDALKRLERYCREECGNAINTVRKELGRVRRVVRQAIRDGAIEAADDPFLAYDMPQRQKPDRRRLSRKEIRALESLGLNGSTELRLARDAFLLSFYGGGVRFGDVCRLRPSNVAGERLTYRMMKTDQPVDLPLPPQAVAIARHWQEAHAGPFIFPFLQEGDASDPVRLRRRISSCNVVVNRNIKKVAKAAGIQKPKEVSTHVARHSFADFARKRSGDLYAVSKALGHSSLQITENYLSDFDREATDRLAGELWEDEQEQ